MFAVEHGGPEVEALGCSSDVVLYGSLVTVGYSANIWIPVSPISATEREGEGAGVNGVVDVGVPNSSAMCHTINIDPLCTNAF